MKRVTDMKGPKNTTAWALLYNGNFVGKLIAKAVVRFNLRGLKLKNVTK